MTIPSLIVVDDASYALTLLEMEKTMSVALGTSGFIELVADQQDSENLIIGHTVPEGGSLRDFETYDQFLRTVPDLVLIDWSLFYGSPVELGELVEILKFALSTGHKIAIVVREAATDELELPAHVVEFFLGDTPGIYHSEF